ncbi:phage tail protein [Cupriavidus pauculus]|uniref:phage tail protein n=1 Tax=Cupriavidus pauculus TaxID=82633 RepID=UPI001247E799|nr:phage tail protein [Cupriavidus pauculus]KAB0601572.1 phage tail protein [Cupriavidus pauculus]UAL01391.1 phage tail protein [Cupriavidus pauculus]
MMMALGLFVFALETAPYQEFQQQIGWRHPSNNRVGRRPSRQFTGLDDETVTLSGVLLPELTGGDNTIEVLRQMGNTGMAFVLIEGSGRYYGMFEIDSLSVTRTLFFKDGKARRIEFSLKLTRVDGQLEQLVGDAVMSAATSLLSSL